VIVDACSSQAGCRSSHPAGQCQSTERVHRDKSNEMSSLVSIPGTARNKSPKILIWNTIDDVPAKFLLVVCAVV